MSVMHLNKEMFEKEIAVQGVTALIDFYADWCGPCKMVGPTIEALADELDNVKVCKVNVDNESELAAMFSVMSIPTIVLMKDGQVLDTQIGLATKAKLLAMIEKAN